MAMFPERITLQEFLSSRLMIDTSTELNYENWEAKTVAWRYDRLASDEVKRTRGRAYLRGVFRKNIFVAAASGIGKTSTYDTLPNRDDTDPMYIEENFLWWKENVNDPENWELGNRVISSVIKRDVSLRKDNVMGRLYTAHSVQHFPSDDVYMIVATDKFEFKDDAVKQNNAVNAEVAKRMPVERVFYVDSVYDTYRVISALLLGIQLDDLINFRVNRALFYLPDHVGEVVKSLASVSGNMRDLRAHLKELGNVSKKHGPNFHELWMDYVNIETAFGYEDAVDMDDFHEDIIDWIQGEIDVTHYDVPGWDIEREGMVEFLQKGPGSHPSKFISIDEFIDNPSYWALTGSTQREVRTKWFDEKTGKEKKGRKTKWDTALSYHREDFSEWLLQPHRGKMKAIQKRERGKVRAVAGSDLPLYLQMSYIDELMKPFLRGHEHTTLYMKTEQQVALFEGMGENSYTKRWWCVPIDQTAFDHNVAIDSIMNIMEVIREFLSAEYGVLWSNEHDNIIDYIKFGISNADVEVGDKFVDYQKGVVSGWKWTAFFDTIVNFSQVYRMRRWLQSLGTDIIDWTCQGDDVQVYCPDVGTAYLVTHYYNTSGIDLNPSKFWIDLGRDEYLRLVAEDGVVRGYVSRLVTTLFERSPITSHNTSFRAQLETVVNNWNIYYTRLGVRDYTYLYEEIEAIVARSLYNKRVSRSGKVWGVNMSGMDLETLSKHLAHTPRAIGGLGLVPLLDEGYVAMSEDTVNTSRPLIDFHVRKNIDREIGVMKKFNADYISVEKDKKYFEDKLRGLIVPPEEGSQWFVRFTPVSVDDKRMRKVLLYARRLKENVVAGWRRMLQPKGFEENHIIETTWYVQQGIEVERMQVIVADDENRRYTTGATQLQSDKVGTLIFGDILLWKLADNGDFDSLGELLLPKILPFWNLLVSGAKPQVIHKWIRNKIKESAPASWNCSPAILSLISKHIFWDTLRELLLYKAGKVDMGDIESAGLLVEMLLGACLEQGVIKPRLLE